MLFLTYKETRIGDVSMSSLRIYDTLGKNCPIKMLTPKNSKVNSKSTSGGGIISLENLDSKGKIKNIRHMKSSKIITTVLCVFLM